MPSKSIPVPVKQNMPVENRATLPSLIGDEKIVQEIRPLPRLKTMWFISRIFSFLIFIIILVVFISVSRHSTTGGATWIFTLIMAFIGLILIWSIISIFLAYNWEYYWITNKRVVRRAGTIGHNFYSVPLERISDVMISRSFWEKIFGIGSLHIKTLAGQFSQQQGYGFSQRQGGIGAETALLALPNPEETQKLIMELVEAKRKREKLSF